MGIQTSFHKLTSNSQIFKDIYNDNLCIFYFCTDVNLDFFVYLQTWKVYSKNVSKVENYFYILTDIFSQYIAI